MPVPNTKIFLGSTILSGGGFTLTPNAVGDFAPTLTGLSAPAWLASVGDLNGDGIVDLAIGASGDDDRQADAGRIFVTMSNLAAGSSTNIATNSWIIDGVNAGDLAGFSIAGSADINGDGLGEILIGAPGVDIGVRTDAGAAYVAFGQSTPGGLDLNDLFTANGGGYAIRGQLAGDAAGYTVLSVGDMNGDGRADMLVGAPGQDAGGVDAGAAYVVWGRTAASNVLLNNVAAGTGGFKIIGAAAGEAVGEEMAVLADQNGDGRAEILIGAQMSDSVYVVNGKATGATVDLGVVATGVGGYAITGAAGSQVGASVGSAGDVNGDGRDDILIGAPGENSAYVVYGKADQTNVDLSNVAAGIGGFRIIGEAAGDLANLVVTGGVDLNRDGIDDLVIGASANGEGGVDAGAVYVVWGGAGEGTVDLSAVAQGFGGAKIVGNAGSLLGSSVVVGADMNGDGVADLIMGAPGAGESVQVLYSPLAWQPDVNIYGTNAADVMLPGYGGVHQIGVGNDAIIALDGADLVDAGAGNDTVEGGGGADTLIGGLGDDSLDGGTGADSLVGGAGDDTYVVDGGDVVVELAGEGIDTVYSAGSHTLAAEVENLILTGLSRAGTGNALNNALTGTGGADTLDGGLGADTLTGGFGNDTYLVDDLGDRVVELVTGGIDSFVASIDCTLGQYVENLTLTGSAHIGTGNAENNILTGGSGNDTLNGLGGIDRMTGGAGDDSYTVASALDQVVEAAAGGTDTVYSSATGYVLQANVENLTLLGTALTGTGNALNNVLTGDDMGNQLDGGVGADTMAGGLGNDTYIVDNAGDVVVETAGGGTDTVLASFDYTLTSGEIENLTLTGAALSGTGNAAANVITGTLGDDTLNGAAGADTLVGGAGNDTYVVDDAGDVIPEAAAAGTDTVHASVSYTLAANLEDLLLTSAGLTGTGNVLGNAMTGSAGADTLSGMEGNDLLDGGSGADLLDGGAGDDFYVIDNVGDVVIEALGGGIDTVTVMVDGLTITDNIENIHLSGAAHVATGGAGNNFIEGAAGDDALDGGGGDDLLLGEEGNDDLSSGLGHDTLVGGTGDDVYHLTGGSVEIEDYAGHDAIDASGSSTNDHIDLSGETSTEIEGGIVHITLPGTTTRPFDVQFLQDLSGSFGDDIASVRGLVPQIVDAVHAIQANSTFGVSSFIDKPVSPFGAIGEWVFQQELAQTADALALATTYNGMAIRYGNDGPEAQIEGLMQLALHESELGFRQDSARFVVLFTDAPYHIAGDGAAGGILAPNNGDSLFPGGGAMEDYPTVAQLSAALTLANITPIFAIAGGYEAVYQDLATQLGRGVVVSLTTNSSNIVSAITNGVTAATTTHIEDATGGAGDDVILGAGEDNALAGSAGNDRIEGRAGADHLDGGADNDVLNGGVGNDVLIGGSGNDTAVYTGMRADYDVVATADGFVLTDLRTGGDGTDAMSGVESFVFADGALAAADLVGGVIVTPTLAAIADDDPTADAVAEMAALGTATGVTMAAVDTTGAAIAVTFALVSDATGATEVLTGAFAIDASTGDVTVRDGRMLDYETATSQSIWVRATSAAGNVMVAAVTLNVLNVFEPIVIPITLTKLVDVYLATTDDHYTVNALAGGDSVTTQGGNDTLNGGAGADTLYSGAGNDTFLVRAGDGADLVDGGIGYDVIRALSANTVIGITSITGIEEITAGGFTGVRLAGGSGANLIDLSATRLTGITLIDGGSGADTITGTLMADTISGGVGNDVLTGGDGDDAFTVSGTTAGYDALDGGLGHDVVIAQADATVIGVLSLVGIEEITSGGFAGVRLAGNAAANLIDLSGTTLTGIARIDGGRGNDTIQGSAGDDAINAGAGVDVLTGGLGNDTFIFALASDSRVSAWDLISDFTQGTDHIDFAQIDADTLTLGDQAFAFIGNTAFSHHAGELRTYTGTAGYLRLLGDRDGNGTADFEIRLDVQAGITGPLTATDFLL